MTLSLGQDRFFTLRAAALFLHNGHVLLQNGDDERVWFVPGGRVHAMEASADALRREIGLYYLAEFVNAERYDTARAFHGMEGTQGLTFRWFPIERMDEVPDIVPPFLYDALKALPGGPRHIVDNNRR